MALLTESEIKRVESKYSEGISSAAVVKTFRAKGARFSEATLRKYVQLGLLPTSRRIGIKGKHRGSSGLYPVAIVRLANSIKQALEAGHSLQSIAGGTIGLQGDLHGLQRNLTQLFGKLDGLAHSAGSGQRTAFKRAAAVQRKALGQAIKQLLSLVASLNRPAKRAGH